MTRFSFIKKSIRFSCFMLLCVGASFEVSHAQEVIILGEVRDDSTFAPLVRANVLLEGTRRGTSTDAAGRFMLQTNLREAAALRVKYIGYAEVRVPLRAITSDTLRLTIGLRRLLLQMPEVEVTSSRADFEEQSLQTQPSVIAVAGENLARVPTVGEPDLFRALQTLPGISAPSQFSNQLYIRGGSSDQNLVRIDGAPVYNPFHLFSLAANINPDLIGQVTVSTGGFSSRYGDRLSGVVDIETRRARAPFVAMGNISLLSSKLTLAGRKGERWQWVLSGRRSYHDLAAKLFGKDLPYHFYDIFGKTTFIPSARHLFNLSLFYSADVLFHTEKYTYEVYEIDQNNVLVTPPNKLGTIENLNRVGFPWDNFAGSLRWEYRSAANWSSTVTASTSRAAYSGFDESEYILGKGVPPEYLKRYAPQGDDYFFEEWSVKNRLQELALAATLLWQPTESWQTQGGVELSNIDYRYRWRGFEAGDEEGHYMVFFDNAPASFAHHANYERRGFFVESLGQLSSRLRVQPSVRWDWRSSSQSLAFDPRLSATYEISPTLRAQAAVGRYHQGLAYLRERGSLGVHELYFAMPFNSAATHAIAGVEYEPNAATNFKVEAYYKKFDRQAVPIGLAPQAGMASGYAYGIETTVKHGAWQMFYVFAHARRNFNGAGYDTPWDLRHRLQLNGQVNMGKNWDFNFQWELHTGQPYTARDIEVVSPIPEYDHRSGRLTYRYHPTQTDYRIGAVRFPVYHRLDVMFSKELRVGKWGLAPYFQVLNLYARKNPLVYDQYYDYSPNSPDRTVKVIKPIGVPPLPTFGARFSF